MRRETKRSLLESHRDHSIGQLIEWMSIPSVSETREGLEDTARFAADWLRRIGCQSVEVLSEDGLPVVWGVWDVGSAEAAIVYGVIDVPTPDIDGWTTGPFQPILQSVGGFPEGLIACGAYQAKGPVGTLLSALETLASSGWAPPVSLLFVLDGGEHVGSPGLPDMLSSKSSELASAEFLFGFKFSQDRHGLVHQDLGTKGLLELDLVARSARTAGRSVHGAMAAITPSPAWRLATALDWIGRDGWRERLFPDVPAISPADLDLLKSLIATLDIRAWCLDRGIEVSGEHDELGIVTALSCLPTLNVSAIFTGNPTEPPKGIVPGQVTARLDVRLVAGVAPDAVLTRLKDDLISGGFGDLSVNLKAAWPAVRTPADIPAVGSLMDVYQDAGVTVAWWPSIPGSIPLHVFHTDSFAPAIVRGGLGHGSGAKEPDEYLVIDGAGVVGGLVESQMSFVDILEGVAGPEGAA